MDHRRVETSDDENFDIEPVEPVELFDDEPDETLHERLSSYLELVPVPVRSAMCRVANTVKILTSNPSLMFVTASFILWARLIQKINRYK